MSPRLSFRLPPELEAHAPPEARGVAREGVKMMVAERESGELTHTTFEALPQILDPGDLVVVNTSATLPAAVDAVDAHGTPLVIHLSTHLTSSRWVVEPRRIDGAATGRWDGAPPSSPIRFGPDGTAHLVAPYRGGRLWEADLDVPMALTPWLAAHGRPIRYSYVRQPWPLETYQNVYAAEPGSAEMPSAGRPFTPEVITRLIAKGVGVTPVVLHTGVASLESEELPYPERVRVHGPTAMRVNATRAAGGRVVAIGTTVVRALESAADRLGIVRPLDGWTDLVITPDTGVRVIDGLLTGWHEPEASHLLMLDAIAGRALLDASYSASLHHRYLWHEFGDVHLIMR